MSIWTNKKLIDTILSAKIIKNKSSIYYSLIEKEMPESENRKFKHNRKTLKIWI